MSANTPGFRHVRDTLRSDAGGSIPWIAGVLISLALLIQMVNASRPGRTDLSDAIGPAVTEERL